MKKISLLLVAAGLSAAAYAGNIDWASGTLEAGLPVSFTGGEIVALYQDVGSDNATGWQTTPNALRVNTDLSVAGGSLGMGNDLFLGHTTFLINQSGFLYLNQVTDMNLAEGISVYTVIIDSASVADGNQGLVIDLTAYTVAGDAVYYCDDDGAGGFHNVSGVLGGVTVIPEPATLGLLSFVGLATFYIRRRFRN